LGFYFSHKLRAGVSFETFNLTKQQQEKNNALEFLSKCLKQWENVIRLTDKRYEPMPYVSIGYRPNKWPEFTAFHWKYFLKDVKDDIDFVKNSE